MLFFHEAYGLAIRSDQPIPGFLEVSERARWDLSICFHPPGSGNRLWPRDTAELYYQSPLEVGEERPAVRVWRTPGGDFSFLYDDETRIEVNQAADRIDAFPPQNLSLADTAYYVTGPALGFVLRQRGTISLHASAVHTGDGAVLFVGDVGAGKSTTAAAMTRHGCQVLTEDLAGLQELENQFLVRRGYPRVNLWPDAVKSLYGTPDALPLVAPPWPKRYLPLEPEGFRALPQTTPIRAIYFLDGRTVASAPELSPLSPRNGLLTLVANTYMNYLPDIRQRARDVAFLARLSGRLPVRRLSPNQNNWDRLCEAILTDLAVPVP